MKAIGGYFGLEIKNFTHYHPNALCFNSARKALEFLLISRKYKCVYLPSYGCHTILDAVKKSHTDFKFYHVDFAFEIDSQLPHLKEDEAILYINYFGLKNLYIKKLITRYRHQLIVDNSQAFFEYPTADCPYIYSPRKFFGVPDGGYLYAKNISTLGLERDISSDNFKHLILHIDKSPEEGYAHYKEAEKVISKKPIRLMSKLTSSLLSNIDYAYAIRIRKRNYNILRHELNELNELNLTFVNDAAVPMTYPLLHNDGELRNKLIAKKIYIARYWPQTISELNKVELNFQQNLLPLPIDHRYDEKDMIYIAKTVMSWI